ncbi:hypothetical protein EC968_003406 [Mortierella alpina]|nr:hypothetical protein EC968_003406 [Mortierella alpina]
MLSSHHGKTPSSKTSRPYHNSDVRNSNNNVDGNMTMAIDGDTLDAMEVSYDRMSLDYPSSPDKTLPFKGNGFAPSSPLKRSSIPVSTPSETSAILTDGPLPAIKLDREMNVIASSSTMRFQRSELSITTDAHGMSTSGGSDTNAPVNMPNNNLHHSGKHSSSSHNQQQQQYPLLTGLPQNQPFQSPHHYNLPTRTVGVSSQLDHGKGNAPPANCSLPTALSRRSSLETTRMSPPSSAGLIKSATTNSFYPPSANDYSPSSPCYSDLGSPIQRAIQRRRSSLSGVSRSNGATNSTNKRMIIDAGAQGIQAKDGSYLPTPTEPSFRSSIHDDPSPYTDCGPPNTRSLPPHMPSTPADAFLSSEVNPFDMSSTAAGAALDARLLNGSSGISTSTASATIQYLQQLQQAMLSQDDYHALNFALGPQGRQLIERQSAQPKQQQQKAPQLGQPTQLRRGSKAKLKRRASVATVQTYPTADMAWSMTAAQTTMASKSNFALTCLNTDHPFSPNTSNNSNNSNGSNSNINNAQSAPSTTTSVPSQQFYHGPAPCGNPEPLYEYLASPTVVPGLEIIGHDYYGNYVQILPICPETTCSMNQDPVYLNLLQAIYAHTIPFLDLAPGSEEETQRLMSSTSSAIATQSIQPPFKNLFPLSNNNNSHNASAIGQGKSSSKAGVISVKQENRATLSSSVSSPSFQQPHSKPSASSLSSSASYSSAGLPRRSSLGSISSITAASNSRRSSTASNPSSANNPARKKKNTPRTHPYKSTSSFKDDNPTVTEAILTQVGGIGGIGNCVTISATDPRHKIAEKMVHMDEAEYTAHYSRHQHAMNKSTSSSTALCLAQTLATSMTGSSLGPLPPSALMSSSVSAPSITHATVSYNGNNSNNSNSNNNCNAGDGVSSLDSIAAADFIRALSQCNNGGGNGLGLKGLGNGQVPSTAASAAAAGPSIGSTNALSQHRDLVSLENLMLLDSNAAAAVQAAAATAWPNWFDLHQLERDVCEVGMNSQASAFTSASCSMTHMPLSNSTTLTSFSNNRSKTHSSTNLLLSSSTDLAMMEDLLDDHAQRTNNSRDSPNSSSKSNHNAVSSSSNASTSSSSSSSASSSSSSSIQSHDSQMLLTVPGATIDNRNSTSQVLVFDSYTAESLSLSPKERSSTTIAATSSYSSSSISSLSSTGTTTTLATTATTTEKDLECSHSQKEPVTNDLTLPYISSLLTVLPFSVEHSHPIFPTRGNRRSGWYRSKSVASQGLSQITGVDYTTTCWYDVERLQNVVRDSISFQESSALKSLEDLTEPDPPPSDH